MDPGRQVPWKLKYVCKGQWAYKEGAPSHSRSAITRREHGDSQYSSQQRFQVSSIHTYNSGLALRSNFRLCCLIAPFGVNPESHQDSACIVAPPFVREQCQLFICIPIQHVYGYEEMVFPFSFFPLQNGRPKKPIHQGWVKNQRRHAHLKGEVGPLQRATLPSKRIKWAQTTTTNGTISQSLQGLRYFVYIVWITLIF